MASTEATGALNAALAIFVKTPGLSPVKTRLAQDIGTESAERFHRMAAAAVAEVVAVQLDIEPYWAVAEEGALRNLSWRDFPMIWQGPGSLGARLHAVCDKLQSHHGRVLMIGADAPQITGDLLQQARKSLDDPATRFVLGRASDGGFWLFGTRDPIERSTWLDIGYSRHDTADQLLARLQTRGNTAILPTLADVDHGNDLPVLFKALNVLPNPLPAQVAIRDWLNHYHVASEAAVDA